MPTREQELEQLVKEQERDMKYGHEIRWRAETSLTDALMTKLSNDGFMFRGNHRNNIPECAVHGRSELRQAYASDLKRGQAWRCKACNREGSRRWWLKNKEKQRELNRLGNLRRRSDPEYRAQENSKKRDAWFANPEYREMANHRRKLAREMKREAGA